MTAWLLVWWVWLALALALGILEILLPTFIFLGFAIGALVMAGLVLFLPGGLAGLGLGAMAALYAALALAAWLVLRRVFRKQSSGAKTFTKDVND